MKDFIRFCGLQLIRWFGNRIRDCDTGDELGTAILINFGGKIHLIGYAGPPIVPVFLPRMKVIYWRCSLGFRRVQEVDFPRINDREKS
jgi:hypothetical protein